MASTTEPKKTIARNTKSKKQEAPATETTEAPIRVATQLTANGKTYNLQFNTLALDTYLRKSQEHNLGVDVLSVGHFTALTYAGIYTHNTLKETKVHVSFEEVYEAVEALLQTTEGFAKLIELYNLFLSVRAVKQLISANNPIDNNVNSDL